MHAGQRSMCGVIVVDAESFQCTWHGRDAIFMIIVLDIFMSIWSSINCPTVICSPTVCYFSREKLLVKTTAPGSLYYICLCDLFSFDFIFRFITTLSRSFANFWRCYPKGIDNPFNTSGCEYLLFVCRSVYVSLLGSPTGSITLVSSLTKIPTVDVLHHPFLFGEIPT